jgi:two-component system sensor histidine kinase MprB
MVGARSVPSNWASACDAPGEQDRVFERFCRADSARSVSGSGLGLASVHQIVERHDGTVWARNGPDGGAWVGFTLS